MFGHALTLFYLQGIKSCNTLIILLQRRLILSSITENICIVGNFFFFLFFHVIFHFPLFSKRVIWTLHHDRILKWNSQLCSRYALWNSQSAEKYFQLFSGENYYLFFLLYYYFQRKNLWSLWATLSSFICCHWFCKLLVYGTFGVFICAAKQKYVLC